MVVKIIFAFSLLAVSIFLISRSLKLLKVIGGAGLLLWLLLGDWGGLELAKKLFLFVKNNMILSLEILAGIFLAIVVLGWILSKLSPGKGSTKRSSIATKTSTETSSGQKTVYIVDSKEFDDYQSALLYAKQFHKDDAATFIRRENR